VKLLTTIVLSITILVLLTACSTNSDGGNITLKNNQDSVSYVIGSQMGQSLESVTDDVDTELIINAMRAKLAGKESLIEDAAAQTLMRDFSNKLREKQQAERDAAGEKNLAEGAAFLEENKSKDGVVTIESGLQYIVITEGDGPKPTATDRVKVHYVGTTLDGEEFDSSVARGEPATFGVTGVIKGWTEALQLMSVGSKYKLFIPSELAYGARGNRNIEPNSTLIFEVELLGIE
jgi:FKBP-type peptidyl-prolyl cis-trans isomerase